ncbi:hypothetical protein L1987_43203 [Smallanthus sonchifolius]|uniref:Uncharacterized protein n=1 Tax=Smallanthus sonchifolius TaxID=185202 RepID=A0ACB9GLZ9_9ASTR|nr:hypothetical protein L1987_43203 [Smallanthus sonchifolius]
MELSGASLETGNLYFVEIGVLVDCPHRISKHLSIEWKGRLLPVWIQETSSCWAPDFIIDSEITCSTPEKPTDITPVKSAILLGKVRNKTSVLGAESGGKAGPAFPTSSELGSNIQCNNDGMFPCNGSIRADSSPRLSSSPNNYRKSSKRKIVSVMSRENQTAVLTLEGKGNRGGGELVYTEI